MAIIESILIRNFKKHKSYNDVFYTFAKNNFIIGENNAGKTTILEALDIFFNLTKIDKELLNDKNSGAEFIVVFSDGKQVAKKFKKDGKIDGEFDSSGLPGFVYLKANNIDFENAARTIIINNAKNTYAYANSKSKLESTLSDSFSAMLNNANDDIIVGMSKKMNEYFSSDCKLELEKSFNIKTKTDELPITNHGLGTQKTFIYSLLLGKEKNNIIVGIDEVHNSLSLNNCKKIIEKIESNSIQTFFTTHVVEILVCAKNNEILPIYSDVKNLTIPYLYKNLGFITQTNKKIILVEGYYDIFWISKAIETLFPKDFHNYNIQSIRGGDNIKNSINYLKDNKNIYFVMDGDKADGNFPIGKNKNLLVLKKSCIELYTPIDRFNELFNVNESELSKKNIEDKKQKLANEVQNFLKNDNDLISELKILFSEGDDI